MKNWMTPASLRRLIAWSVGSSIPAWIALAVLGLLDHLEWSIAIFAGIIILVMMAALILSRLADFNKLIVYAEQLAGSPETRNESIVKSAKGRRSLYPCRLLLKTILNHQVLKFDADVRRPQR